jgi:hypothetical protein
MAAVFDIVSHLTDLRAAGSDSPESLVARDFDCR